MQWLALMLIVELGFGHFDFEFEFSYVVVIAERVLRIGHRYDDSNCILETAILYRSKLSQCRVIIETWQVLYCAMRELGFEHGQSSQNGIEKTAIRTGIGSRS
jgi:hypothetical protein